MQYGVDTLEAEENTGGFVLIPEDTYEAMVIEKSDKITSKGDPMVSVKMEILNGQYKGKWLFDNIVIPKTGSPSFKIMGRTMHFLHVIGQPYQGKFKTDSDKWLWAKLKVKVKHEVQKEGKYAGQKMARIDGHDFYDTASAEPEHDPEVPF